jgi:hypothetical protein
MSNPKQSQSIHFNPPIALFILSINFPPTVLETLQPLNKKLIYIVLQSHYSLKAFFQVKWVSWYFPCSFTATIIFPINLRHFIDSQSKKSHELFNWFVSNRRDLYENSEHNTTTGGATCLRQTRHHLVKVKLKTAGSRDDLDIECSCLFFSSDVNFISKLFVSTLPWNLFIVSTLCNYCVLVILTSTLVERWKQIKSQRKNPRNVLREFFIAQFG